MSHQEHVVTPPDAAAGLPRNWYPYCEMDGSDLVTPEIVSALAPDGVDALTKAEKEMRYSELKALLRSAARGTLRDSAWKSVSKDPTLWELRWRWDGGDQLRGYFHEPSLEPDSTVLAKVHRKEIVGNDDRKTKQLQNEEIDAASIRIQRGRTHRWGLDASQPLA